MFAYSITHPQRKKIEPLKKGGIAKICIEGGKMFLL